MVQALREDNLFAPLPGDRGAHGRFDAKAKNRSWLGVGVGAIVASAVMASAVAVMLGGRTLRG
jgi:hypothetical protein